MGSVGRLSELRPVLRWTSLLFTMATFIDNVGTLTDDGVLHISHSEIKHLIHKVDTFDSNRIIDVGFVGFMTEGVNEQKRERT